MTQGGTMRRWGLLGLLFILAAAVNWRESWAIMLLMGLPVFVIHRLLRARHWPVLIGLLGLALLGALGYHLGMAHLLGGFLRPAQVLWSAWFFLSLLCLLEAIDTAAGRLGSKLPGKLGRPLLRLAVIVLLFPPLIAGLVQGVRVKLGYRLPPAAADHQPTPFAVRSAGGVTIRGHFFDQSHPTTLVIAHGLGAHSENFLPYLLPLLERQPVNGLIFDFRAHGYSDGHVSGFGGPHEQADLRAALHWLERQHPQAARHLIFYGFSMGAAATLPVAADHPRTRGVILDSSYARLTDVAWAIAAPFPPGLRQFFYYTALPVASAATGTALWNVQPERALDRLHAPTLILHGQADRMIPVAQAQRLLERRPEAVGSIVEGAEHNNLPLADPTYFHRIADFIHPLLPAPTETTP